MRLLTLSSSARISSLTYSLKSFISSFTSSMRLFTLSSPARISSFSSPLRLRKAPMSRPMPPKRQPPGHRAAASWPGSPEAGRTSIKKAGLRQCKTCVGPCADGADNGLFMVKGGGPLYLCLSPRLHWPQALFHGGLVPSQGWAGGGSRIAWKSVAFTFCTASLNSTRQVRLSVLVGEEGVCHLMEVTRGAIVSAGLT